MHATTPIRSAIRRLSSLVFLVCASRCAAADDTQIIECPVSADTTLISYSPDGRKVCLGGVEVLHAQANRRFMLMKFDTSKLEGMEVVRASLRLKHRDEVLSRISIGTVAAPWQEGTSTDWKPQVGGACYMYAAYDDQPNNARPWAWRGSDFSDVAFGSGGSRWTSTDTEFDRKTELYSIDVPPAFVQALAQGLQPGGLAIADECDREPMPMVYSKEAVGAPALIVEARRTASHKSAAPANVRAYRDDLGLEWVAFDAPQALGFDIVVADHAVNAKDDVAKLTHLQTWSLPSPGETKRRALISLYRQATETHVAVRTVESAATWSDWVVAPLPEPVKNNPRLAAPTLSRFDVPRRFDRPFVIDEGPALSRDARWMRTAGKTWWDPYGGPVSLQAGRNEFVAFQVILCGESGKYHAFLSDWKSPGAAQPAVRTSLFREDYVKARIGREKYGPDPVVPLKPDETLNLTFDRWTEATPATLPAAEAPTAAAPAKNSQEAASKPAAEGSAEPTSRPADSQPAGPPPGNFVQAIWVELYVPHSAATGVWRSRVIVLRDGAAILDMPVELEVVEPTLPDELTFPITLVSNRPLADIAGAAVGPAGAWSLLDNLYRTAHEHCTTFVVEPTRADGKIEPGFAPEVRVEGQDGKLAFEEWDRRFARYFDGSAFRDLPRSGVPLSHFVLPFCENWPLLQEIVRAPREAPPAAKYHYRASWNELRSMNRHRNPPPDSFANWPIEQALPQSYQELTPRMMHDFVQHLAEKGWKKTDFQVAPSHIISGGHDGAWWDLNRPQLMDDYRALHFWLSMWRRGGATPDSPVHLRVNLSQPQFGRDALDGLVDGTTIDLSFFDNSWYCLMNRDRLGKIWQTDWPLDPELSWTSVYRWGWAACLGGADGLCVNDAVGDEKSWDEAVNNGVLYPAPKSLGGTDAGATAIIPSLRLKALRRVQQDVEWINLWRARTAQAGTPRGYYLSVLGSELLARFDLRTPLNVNLLPVFEMPGLVDTVVFEEIRRGLRAAAK